MKIVKDLNGVPKAWKCAGILDMETGQRCCNGKTLSIRYGSFFYNRKLPVRETLSILYGWALKMSRTTIAEFTGCSPEAVRTTLNDWY